MNKKLNKKEVAAILNKCESTITNYVNKKYLSVDDEGLFDEDEIYAFKDNSSKGIIVDGNGIKWISKSGAARELGTYMEKIDKYLKDGRIRYDFLYGESGRKIYRYDDVLEYKAALEEQKVNIKWSLFGKIKL